MVTSVCTEGICIHSMDTSTQAVMFSRASDEWETPQDLYDALDQEFEFDIDAAATARNAKCQDYYTLADDALTQDWRTSEHILHDEYADENDERRFGSTSVWMNPPYSHCAEFVEKAHSQMAHGVTTVALLPSRTDTRWWHDHVWLNDTQSDTAPHGILTIGKGSVTPLHLPHRGVEVRFIKGRLRFSKAKNSAPFPSVIVVFYGR